MPAGSWIYDITTPTGGGAPGPPFVPPDAPPVTILGYEIEEQFDGMFEVRVNWAPDATATPDNFRAVAVFLEDPDISAMPNAPLDGSVILDGTVQVSGKWVPTRETDVTISPATLLVKGKPRERDLRIYLQAFNQVTNATLVRANKPDPTPNIVVPIPAAAGAYVSGQEYAWLITDPAVIVVPNFENPAGATYSLKFSFTEPDPGLPLPPGMKEFGGVQTVYEYEDGRQANARFLLARRPDTWISDEYAASSFTFTVYFCSADVEQRVNTVVPGVTPSVLVTVVYPPSGQGSSPDITGFVLSNPRHAWQPDGTIYALADLAWTPPDSRRFGGVVFYRTDQLPVRELARAANNISHLTLQIIDWPKTAQAWKISAIPYDYNNKLADNPDAPRPLTPFVTWNIGPPSAGGTGQENAPLISIAGVTITTEQQLNSDGVVMMRHKIGTWINLTDNKYGALSIARVFGSDFVNATWWDAAKNATALATDWEPAPSARSWDFYFVSRDPQDQRNSILPGVTPKITHAFTPIAGDVIASRLPDGWWNEDEFQWPSYPAGEFQAKQFVAEKIFVGSILRVGGGVGSSASSFAGNANGQIAVYNAFNVIRAWMGQQSAQPTPDNPTPHAVYGGWFSELYLGGDGPSTAPIYARQDGTVIVGGWDIAGTRFPYISIRRNDGVEVGRMGARIGQGLVAPSDPAYIAGGWFKEFACGGQSLSDWRILARKDPTNVAGGDLVNMRNINRFTIDYIANYPSATNPTNAAMQLDFGYDAFVADVASSSYWKFPGIKIVRTGTTHQMVLINRGIVLTMPSGLRAGAFVTFNGDQFGSDVGTFWTEVTMNSPVSNLVNVQLASGNSANGGAIFKLWDQSNVLNFSVDQSGNVAVRAAVTASGVVTGQQYFISGPTQVITSGGQFNGPGGVNTTSDGRFSGFVRADNGYYSGATQIIDSTGRFISPQGVLSTTAFIGGAQFGAFFSGAWTFGATGQFIAKHFGGGGSDVMITVRGGIITAIG